MKSESLKNIILKPDPELQKTQNVHLERDILSTITSLQPTSRTSEVTQPKRHTKDLLLTESVSYSEFNKVIDKLSNLADKYWNGPKSLMSNANFYSKLMMTQIKSDTSSAFALITT